MSPSTSPRLGTAPRGSWNDSDSTVRFSSRMLSLSGCGVGNWVGVAEFFGRKIVLKPRPLIVPVNALSGPRAGAISAGAGGATPGWTGTSLMVKSVGICTAEVSFVRGRARRAGTRVLAVVFIAALARVLAGVLAVVLVAVLAGDLVGVLVAMWRHLSGEGVV